MNDQAQLVTEEARAAMRARAQEIADELIGTAKSYSDALNEGKESDDTLAVVVRELCFECDCCGWWASIDELNNENNNGDEECDECFDSKGEDD